MHWQFIDMTKDAEDRGIHGVHIDGKPDRVINVPYTYAGSAAFGLSLAMMITLGMVACLISMQHA